MSDQAAWKGAAAVAGLLLCTGCYGYVPVELGSVPPGGEVRVELTRVGFAQLPEIPNHPGPDLSGTVVGNAADQLRVRVPVAIRRDGLITNTIQQEIGIPATDIVRMERRQFSRQRTAVAMAGAVGIAASLFAAFGDRGPPAAEPPEKPIDEEAGFRAGRLGGLLRFSIPLP